MIHLEKRIIVLAGLPLTGKTSLGHELTNKTDAVFLDVDKVRQEIAPGKDWLGADREREIMLEAYKKNHEGAPKFCKLVGQLFWPRRIQDSPTTICLQSYPLAKVRRLMSFCLRFQIRQ